MTIPDHKSVTAGTHNAAMAPDESAFVRSSLNDLRGGARSRRMTPGA